jgi:hypothetical protein
MGNGRSRADGQGSLRDLHRYAPNISLLFTDLPLVERPAAVADAGFDAVDCGGPSTDPSHTRGTPRTWSARCTTLACRWHA